MVQLDPQQYMVIGLESAAWVSQTPVPRDCALRTCTQHTGTLDEQRRFTTASDIYLIGGLLEEAMPFWPRWPSAAARRFIKRLLHKELSAYQALEYLKSDWLPSAADPVKT